MGLARVLPMVGVMMFAVACVPDEGPGTPAETTTTTTIVEPHPVVSEASGPVALVVTASSVGAAIGFVAHSRRKKLVPAPA